MPGKLKVVRFADDDVYYSPAPPTPSPTYSSDSLPSTPGPLTPPQLKHGGYPYFIKPLPLLSEPSPLSASRSLGPVRIHPALGFAPNPTFLWDLASHPSTSHTPLPAGILASPATNPPLPAITIISPYLPWSIVITPASHSHKPIASPNAPPFVTVADVLYTLHRSLRLPVRPAEYDQLPSLEAKHCVNVAYQSRCQGREDEARKGVKRVDFLSGRRTFLGLSSSQAGPTVWVLNVS